MKKLFNFLRDETGASAVEYGLLVALIAAVIVGAVTLLGGNLKATFTYIAGIVLKP
jgi:pilus assembly protein Flp/PilA